MEERPPIWRAAANVLNKQSRQPTTGGPPAWGFGEVLTTPPGEKSLLRNIHKARCFLWRQNNPEVNYSTSRISRGGFLEEVSRSKKRGILLGTWKVRSLYRAGSLKMDLREVGGGGD